MLIFSVRELAIAHHGSCPSIHFQSKFLVAKVRRFRHSLGESQTNDSKVCRTKQELSGSKIEVKFVRHV